MTTEAAERPEVASEVVDRAEFKDGAPIVAYSRTEQALAELRQRLEGARFDLTTTAGDKAARAARLELVTLRTDLEKRRKAFKAPALEFGRLIDAEAERIRKQIEVLEKPIDEQIRADEARREEEREAREAAERERVAKLRTRIDYMRGVAARAAGKPSAEVRAKLDMMQGLAIGEDFGDLQAEAQQVHAEVTQQLRDMLAAVEAQEAEALRLKGEREAMERQRHLDAKVQELRMLSVGMAGKSVAELFEAMTAVAALNLDTELWGDAAGQERAKEARAAVLAELRAMHGAAHERQCVAVQQAAEAQRLAQQRAEQEEREQLQTIAETEIVCATLNAEGITRLLGVMVAAGHQKFGASEKVSEARHAAIIRVRALRDATAAKEADALRVEQERRDNAASQNSQRQESEGAPALTDQSPIAPLGTVQAEGETVVSATVSPGCSEASASSESAAPAGGALASLRGVASMPAGETSESIVEKSRAAWATPPAEEPATLNLGAMCARFGEGLTMTRAYVEQVLKVPATGTSPRGVALWSEAGFRAIAAAQRDVAARLAGAA